MKYLLPLILLAGLALTSRPNILPVADADTSLYEVMRSLGAPERADIMVRPVDGASEQLGRQIVLEGQLAKGGKQSAHFKCTSCHNTVREDPVLTDINPTTRLAYAEANDLPFLPGTTLWGAVNRESYYNDGYEKKYGDLVKAARHDLRGAIQLCATECAQGEPLNEVEMESVMTYLHTISLKLKDLPEGAPTVKRVNDAIAEKSAAKGVIEDLKKNYLLASPASFTVPPKDRKAGYTITGKPNPANGRAIYERGCLHCHENQRYSFFELADSEDHWRFMTKHFPRYDDRYSTYQVVRYGTSPIPGKRAYMPHYTQERMADLQVEELRDYLAAGSAR